MGLSHEFCGKCGFCGSWKHDLLLCAEAQKDAFRCDRRSYELRFGDDALHVGHESSCYADLFRNIGGFGEGDALAAPLAV